MKSCLLFFGLMLLGVGPVLAQVNSHSDASDGVLRVVNNPNFVIDLSAARTDSAYAPGTGNGVYDAKKWAVVFKYDSVFVDNASIVRFINHPSNAPGVKPILSWISPRLHCVITRPSASGAAAA